MKHLRPVFLAVLCTLSLQLQAQVSLGIQGGYTRAWEEYGEVELPEDASIHIHAFYVSGAVWYPLNKYLRIGAEPGFVRRGAACEPGFLIFNSDTRLRLNYAEIPLLMGVELPLFREKLAVSAKTGYGAAFLLSASREVMNIGDESPFWVKTQIDLTDSNMRRWDHGLHGGLGLALNLGNNQLLLEGKYYLGLTDADVTTTSKNRSLQFGLGYRIRL